MEDRRIRGAATSTSGCLQCLAAEIPPNAARAHDAHSTHTGQVRVDCRFAHEDSENSESERRAAAAGGCGTRTR